MTAFDDPSGNSFAGITDSTTWNFTTADTTTPVISVVDSSVSNTGATITWTTDEQASSQIEYGLTSSYGNTTSETDISPRVTSHSVALSSLNPCATYHYRVKGSDGTFTATGSGSVPILTQTNETVTKASGANFQLNTGTDNLTLTVPVNFASDTSAEFQLHQITSSNVIASTGIPTENLSVIGNHTYSLLALTDIATTITTFDNPLALAITYTDEEIGNLTESALLIYRGNGSVWNALDNCSVNQGTNTVTCETSHFSTFGVFGSSSSGGTGLSCSEKATMFSFEPEETFSQLKEFSFFIAPEKVSLSWQNETWVKEHLQITIANNEVLPTTIIVEP